jgi:hypothetical protein
VKSWTLIVMAMILPSWASPQSPDPVVDTIGISTCAKSAEVPNDWPTFHALSTPLSFRAPKDFRVVVSSDDQSIDEQQWVDTRGNRIVIVGMLRPPADERLQVFRRALPPRSGAAVDEGCDDCFRAKQSCIRRSDAYWFLLIVGHDGWGINYRTGVALSVGDAWATIWIAGKSEDVLELGRQIGSTLRPGP